MKPSKQPTSSQQPLEVNQADLRAAMLEGLVQRRLHSASGAWWHGGIVGAIG